MLTENPTSSSEVDSTTCSNPEVTDCIDLSATYCSPPCCLVEAIPYSSDPKDQDRHFKMFFRNMYITKFEGPASTSYSNRILYNTSISDIFILNC